MKNAELVNHLQAIGNQLVQLHEYRDYQRLCDEAKNAASPTIEDAFSAVLYAIKWAESQSGSK